MSKILEKIVSIKLYHYLVNNNLLYDLQFGFQPGKSTVHPLIYITNFIANAFNNNEIVIAVFLDLKKAFDVVDPSILLKKLKKLGVNGTTLLWFKNYLKVRYGKSGLI